MEKLGFFQEDGARLNAAEYRSPAALEAFADFARFLEEWAFVVASVKIARQRALSAEFELYSALHISGTALG
jgi:hypothetical protein